MRKITTLLVGIVFVGIACTLCTNMILLGTTTRTMARSIVPDMIQEHHTAALTVEHLRKLTDGYKLAKRIHDTCNTSSYKPTEVVFGSYLESVQTCVIWKSGSTFLKRLYMMKKQPVYRNIINPYDISFDKRYILTSKISNLPDKSRFMFVRDPYSRLLSGFVDKLLAPNPVYWKTIGVPAIRLSRRGQHNINSKSLKCGHDLTFREYVNYVIATLSPKSGRGKVRTPKPDGHFNRMTSLCKPCAVNYDFIGKMESFSVDALELARRLKMSNKTIQLLETEGYNYSWLDAIKDSAHQPFDKEFVKYYTPCISFYEALWRSWTKMQIRGLIGKEEFSKTPDQVSNLTEKDFVNLAVKSREASNSKERHELKEIHFVDMFSTISIGDLEIIRKIYANDFKLFEYDDRPKLIFSRR